jgi:UDP:flavonoid glycosyltransferase YjiC (YdhE family)
LPRGRNPVFEGQHSPRLVLALYSPRLASRQPDTPAQTLITGFAFYDGGNERPIAPDLLRFLDDGEPPLLFTLGSSAVWIAGDFYQTSIAAAQALKRRALLLAGEEAGPLRAAGLPPGIAVFDYAPHSAVMPRAAVVVHQGGVGTTGQALRAGRPALVVPFGQDQPDNARRCVELGVAQTLTRRDYVTRRVSETLAELADTPSYAARAAALAGDIRAEQGTTTACDAIEAALRS